MHRILHPGRRQAERATLQADRLLQQGVPASPGPGLNDSVRSKLIRLIFSLVSQAIVNMLVSVEIFPVTGQTLPLISMGGTSIVFSCIAIGVVLSMKIALMQMIIII